MNILFVSPSLPSRLHRVRSVNLIKYLSRFHQIHLVTLASKYQRDFELEEVKKYCTTLGVVYKSRFKSWWQSFLFLFTSIPLEIAYTKNYEMNQKVKEVIERQKIDLIYIKRLRSAQFVKGIENIPMVLDSTDAMSLYYNKARMSANFLLKILFTEEYLTFKKYEEKLAKKFKNWVVSSPFDKDYLLKRLKDVNVKVIPNGADLEYYQDLGVSPEPNTIIFSGLMDKQVNVTSATYFYYQIYSKIKKEIPDIKLLIVGPNPTSQIKALQKDASVTVTGFVRDLRDYILKGQVIVSPVLIGTGTRNKILQAWALGRPVVSTYEGAQGLDHKHGKDILIANSPQDFTDSVIRLLKDEDFRKHIVQGGREVVQEKYSMDKIINNLNNYLSYLVN